MDQEKHQIREIFLSNVSTRTRINYKHMFTQSDIRYLNNSENQLKNYTTNITLFYMWTP